MSKPTDPRPAADPRQLELFSNLDQRPELHPDALLHVAACLEDLAVHLRQAAGRQIKPARGIKLPMDAAAAFGRNMGASVTTYLKAIEKASRSPGEP